MLTRLKKRFLDLPISQKFVSIFAVMTLLSCAVMVGALHLGLSVFEEKLYEKSLQELDFFVQSIDDDLQQMDVLTRSIAVDTTIQSQLAQLTAADPETAQYYYLLTGVRPLLLEKLYMSGQADALQFVDLNGNAIVVGQSFPDPGEERRIQLADALNRTPGSFALLPPDADYPYFICGRDVLRSQNMSMQRLGTVLVTVDIEKLLNNQIDALSNKPSELYLYNKEALVYQSGETAADFTLPDTRQGYAVQTMNGQKVFVCWLTSGVSGLRLCSVFNYSEIYGQTTRARWALLLGGCAILVLFGWVMLRMARLVTRPVHTLSEAVKSVEGGDFTTARAMLPNTPAADEIGTLTRDVDAMLGQIDTLIHENYEKQLLLQDTRYKMLQAQINPHFLYNTLSTLSWLVRAGKNEDAGRLIINLGDMLRAALSPKQNTTAAADVQLVRSYIEIQQLRYKRRAVFARFRAGLLTVTGSARGTAAQMAELYEQARRLQAAAPENTLTLLERLNAEQHAAAHLMNYDTLRNADSYAALCFACCDILVSMQMQEISPAVQRDFCMRAVRYICGSAPTTTASTHAELLIYLVDNIWQHRTGDEPIGKATRTEQMILREFYAYLPEKNFTMQWFAREILFMNPDYLSRKIEKMTGDKFATRLIADRIEIARHLLTIDPTLKMTKLAETVGFAADEQYFSRIFRKLVGATPKQYAMGIADKQIIPHGRV